MNEDAVMDDYQKQMEREWARQCRHDKKRLSIVARFHTKKYMAQVRELMQEIGCHSLSFAKDTPKAKKQQCDEFPAIKWEWVYQWENGGYSGDSYAGFLYIEFKSGRFLRMQYAM